MRASPAGPTNGALNGNEAGAERLIAYQKFLRRGDISLTHTIVQPTVDKATGRRAVARATSTPCTRSARPSTASSCAARACWPPLAPFADELAVYPAAPMPEGADAYALSLLRADGRAGAEVHVPRQRLGRRPTASIIRCRAASTSRMPSSSSTTSRCRATACSSTPTAPPTTR